MKYGGAEAKQFVTNLSLITSRGKWGDNIMTAEWVHHISYKPGLVMVNIHEDDATAENIMQSKEFGVNVASEAQGKMIKIAGNSSGKETDKIAVLKELGFEFYKAKEIGAYMIKGAALNLECRLIRHEKMGDHSMFIGEVVSVSAGNGEPIIFRSGTGLFKIGEKLVRDHNPEQEEKVKKLLEKHAKK